MSAQPASIEQLPVDALIPYARNSRTHDDAQIAQIAASIREFGFTNPVLVDGSAGIIAGHGRVLAARKLGLAHVPAIRLAHLSEAQKRAYVIADNKLALNAGWDLDMLKLELGDLAQDDFDLTLTGFSLEEISGMEEDPEAARAAAGATLAERFMLPPFSVFNAREGWWQERKRAWLALGIQSELGRGAIAFESQDKLNAFVGQRRPTAAPGGSNMVASYEGGKRQVGLVSESGTSVFDPVLCEIAYRWFCPAGGQVLDPFAGGSVRGIVAARLGRRYTGQELRGEQVAANREQAAAICADDQFPPAWLQGDSRSIDASCKGLAADFLFTCPPYADLERYSDDPADLSTLAYAEFRPAYREIIRKACALLLPDRFACIVVGEVRDRAGSYINFVGDTVEAFRAAGLAFYNEAILVTAVGSLPIRAGKQFSASRKLGKTHQNVLIFCKGDGKRAAKACGAVQVAEALEAAAAEGEDQDPAG